MNNSLLSIFEQGWPSKDTVCGWSSDIEHTKNIRWFISRYFLDKSNKFGIKSINDIGCGDLFWMKTIISPVIDDYVGYDCYSRANWPSLVENGYKLNVCDVSKDSLRKADVCICRDIMIHLPNNMVLNIIDNIKNSGAKYLFATNYLNPIQEEDYSKYGFSNFERKNCPYIHHMKLDLTQAPFNLGRPLTSVAETYPYKNMSLWRL